MPKFAYVVNGQIKEDREYPSQPACKKIGGVNVIRPMVEQPKPAYDEITQELIKEELITPVNVIRSWVVSDLSPEQIAVNQQNAFDLVWPLTRIVQALVENESGDPALLNQYNAERLQ